MGELTLTQVLSLITGPVGALVVMVCWLWALRQDIKQYRQAMEAERRRADSAEEAARTTNQLLHELIGRRER